MRSICVQLLVLCWIFCPKHGIESEPLQKQRDYALRRSGCVGSPSSASQLPAAMLFMPLMCLMGESADQGSEYWSSEPRTCLDPAAWYLLMLKSSQGGSKTMQD